MITTPKPRSTVVCNENAFRMFKDIFATQGFADIADLKGKTATAKKSEVLDRFSLYKSFQLAKKGGILVIDGVPIPEHGFNLFVDVRLVHGTAINQTQLSMVFTTALTQCGSELVTAYPGRRHQFSEPNGMRYGLYTASVATTADLRELTRTGGKLYDAISLLKTRDVETEPRDLKEVAAVTAGLDEFRKLVEMTLHKDSDLRFVFATPFEVFAEQGRKILETFGGNLTAAARAINGDIMKNAIESLIPLEND